MYLADIGIAFQRIGQKSIFVIGMNDTGYTMKSFGRAENDK